jgi:hypothetical protein
MIAKKYQALFVLCLCFFTLSIFAQTLYFSIGTDNDFLNLPSYRPPISYGSNIQIDALPSNKYGGQNYYPFAVAPVVKMGFFVDDNWMILAEAKAWWNKVTTHDPLGQTGTIWTIDGSNAFYNVPAFFMGNLALFDATFKKNIAFFNVQLRIGRTFVINPCYTLLFSTGLSYFHWKQFYNYEMKVDKDNPFLFMGADHLQSDFYGLMAKTEIRYHFNRCFALLSGAHLALYYVSSQLKTTMDIPIIKTPYTKSRQNHTTRVIYVPDVYIGWNYFLYKTDERQLSLTLTAGARYWSYFPAVENPSSLVANVTHIRSANMLTPFFTVSLNLFT